MSILDCMCSLNGLIKECFAWVIEASSESDKMHFLFFKPRLKQKRLGMEFLFVPEMNRHRHQIIFF